MKHDMKSITAELARIGDSLSRVEAALADLLGEDDPYSRAVAAATAAPEGVNLVTRLARVTEPRTARGHPDSPKPTGEQHRRLA